MLSTASVVDLWLTYIRISESSLVKLKPADDGMRLWMPMEMWCLRKAMIRWKHNYAVNYITLFLDDVILGIKRETLIELH